jgi:putative transposase
VGIDIGVRSFVTCYSPEKTYLIGNNTDEYIDRINKRLDNIKSNHDKNKISDSKYNKVYSKYSEKLKNKIKDLHNKTAKFLLERFREITIGKVSIKSMTSKLTGNIKKITKRRLLALSHYKFRMKLHQMKNKYNVKINETSEYNTSKTCSNCKYINKKTKSKTFSCKKCKLVIDRDINASINIYNEEY